MDQAGAAQCAVAAANWAKLLRDPIVLCSVLLVTVYLVVNVLQISV